VIVTNDTIAPLYLDQFITALNHANVSHIILPDGEQFKDLAHFEKVHSFL